MKGEIVPTYEVDIVTKNGEKIPAEINASALYEHDEFVGDFVIIRDLRDRVKRQEIEKTDVDQGKGLVVMVHGFRHFKYKKTGI